MTTYSLGMLALLVTVTSVELLPNLNVNLGTVELGKDFSLYKYSINHIISRNITSPDIIHMLYRYTCV